MADKTQINLERIRACDAEWEESKHPRSENGQFTSGGGVKVSKATPDMKKGWHKYGNRQGFGKPAEEAAHNEKKARIRAKSDDLTTRVAGKGNAKTAKERRMVLSAAKQTIAKARPKIAAMRELAKAAQPDSANESVKSAVNKHIKQIKSVFAQYPDQAKNLSKDATDMFKKAEKAGALEKAAEFLKRKEKLDAEMVKQDKAGNRNEWYDGLSQEDKNLVSSSVTGVLAMATRKVEESNSLRKTLKSKEEHKAKLLSKVIASETAKADANKAAKEQIFKQAAAASKKTAEAKAAKEAAAAKKTLSDIDSRIAEAKRKGDIKSVSFLEAAKASAQKKAAAPAAKPKASKNNGGLEDYKYKPPSKLEGFPIVMASKKTNSGLGGGNRFKFGFKKYKDGIMIRYVDDYWDASDYAFVPLKNPTLENAYSYSDKASSNTVSALKDSLVTNEELGKIARQLK